MPTLPIEQLQSPPISVNRLAHGEVRTNPEETSHLHVRYNYMGHLLSTSYEQTKQSVISHDQPTGTITQRATMTPKYKHRVQRKEG